MAALKKASRSFQRMLSQHITFSPAFNTFSTRVVRNASFSTDTLLITLYSTKQKSVWNIIKAKPIEDILQKLGGWGEWKGMTLLHNLLLSAKVMDL